MNAVRSAEAEFNAVRAKWVQIHELLSLGLVSPEVQAHVGGTLEHLERRMWELAPTLAAAVLSVRPERMGSGSMVT